MIRLALAVLVLLAGCAGAPAPSAFPARDRTPASPQKGVASEESSARRILSRLLGGVPLAVTGVPSDGQVLTYDSTTGTWRAESAAGGGETLAQTLALGATTGGTHLTFSSGDQLRASAALVTTATTTATHGATGRLDISIGASTTNGSALGAAAEFHPGSGNNGGAINVYAGETDTGTGGAILLAAGSSSSGTAGGVTITPGIGGSATTHGLATINAHALLIEAFTGGDTLTARESGKLCHNTGAGATVTLTLPTGSNYAGIHYTFLRVAAQAFRVDPNAADNVVYSGGAMANGEYLELGSAGAKLTLAYDAANTAWIATEEFGTLTEETP